MLVAATMVFGAPSTQAAVPNGVGSASGGKTVGSTIFITDSLSSQHFMATPGTTVTWVNRDNEPHRLKSDDSSGAGFDSGVLAPGDRFSHRFTSASDVVYRDVRNADDPAYLGMVMVEAASGPSSAVSAEPALAPLSAPGSVLLASDEDESAGGVNAKRVTVEIHNANEFRPATATIAVGGTVTWFNDHSEPHTASGAGGINSGDLDRDERYSHTFNKAGTYDYVCAYHEEMQATVRVANANGKVPPPPPDNGGGTPPPPGNGGQQVAISIGSNFSPANVTVPAGSVVTWTNNDGSPHTATGQGFDSGNLNNGQTYSHTFNTPGTYQYVCSYHSDMVGTLKVTDSSGEVPPPPPDGGTPPPPPDGGGGGGGTPPPPSGGGGGGGGGTDAPASASVTVDDDFFSPKAVTIRSGGTVTWTNRGNYHTVTASNGAFDSGMLGTGKSFRHTFKSAGTYTYDCILHDGMSGTVKVVSASGTVPPPDKTPGGDNKAPRTPGGPGGGGAGGGGGGGGSAPSSPGSQTHTVTMGTDSFSPSTLSARVGDTVVFKNGSPVPHNVNGGSAFKSPTVMGGQSFETVLRKEGTISYKCDYHSGMTGTIKVGAAPAGVKVPPPSAGGGLSGPSSGGLPTSGSSGGSSSSSGSSGGTPAPNAQSYTIDMVNSTFDPQVLEARVGDEVTWVNQDPVPHNVTGGPLDSGMMMGGDEFTTVLTEAGTIEYECTLHPGMTGTLEVAEALPGTDVPPASSSTTNSSGSSDSAASSGPSTPSAEAAEGAQNHTVEMVDFLYNPDPLEVHVGDTVTFVNKDAAPHTATAEDKSWDSGNMNQGDEWTLKVDETGEIPYICIYHPDMTGTLIVKDKDEKLAPVGASSESGSTDTTGTSASQIAGFSSGWLALLAFLAGLQLQSRFASRRRTSSPV